MIFPGGRNVIRSFVSAAVCIFISGEALRAEPSVDPVQKTLERLVARNKGQGGGVIRISDGHGVLWEGTAGSSGGPGSPAMTVDTPFEVASITKAVTSATVLRLVEEKKLRLDSTLGKLLPAQEMQGFDGNITVRQLLSHTSGLPDYWTDGPHDWRGNNAFLRAFLAEPKHLWTPQEILRFASEMPAKKRGGHFHYSDTNYVLLGLIIERVTGHSLHHVFRELIFEPLGMKNTWLTYHEAQRGEAPSHRFEKKDDLNAVPRQSADWASGGLVSTTRDLEKFLRGLASGKLFKNPDTLQTMREDVPVGEEDISYGLGIYRVKLDNNQGELWGHDGHGNSFAYYWPQRDVTITGTLNQTENDWWPVAEAYIEGEGPGLLMNENGKALNVNILTGWDSLYMYRGVNSLRNNGGYGNSIAWSEVNAQWGMTGSDYLTLDFWQGYATSGPAYREYDGSLIYTHSTYGLDLSFEYDFDYGYGAGIGNLYSNELATTASYDYKIGKATITPSLSYFFNLGPDSESGPGFSKGGAGYLLLRMDGRVPVYKEVIALAPWSAFSMNFGYNTRGLEDDATPFNGPNNIECGLALPIKINKWATFSIYGAYSYALTDLTNTSPDTFWGGVNMTLSF